MSQTQINNNLVPSDPHLKDLLDLLKKDIMLSLFSHHLGTIQSFDATTQTATATINYKKTYFQLNTKTNNYDPVLVDYPLLIDCPVVFLGGGVSALTFPVVQGDECLICFNDRDIDNWFQGASNGAVATPRLHSSADGIIFVGIRSKASKLQNLDTARAVLRGSLDGTTMVGVGPLLIKIANNTTTLNTLLQSLLTQLQNILTQIEALTVTCATAGNPSSVPVNAAAFAAIGVSITTLSTEIAGLLE